MIRIRGASMTVPSLTWIEPTLPANTGTPVKNSGVPVFTGAT